MREAFRVLKPGGRFAVSDVVVRGEVPADVRKSMELWVGCMAGTLQESEYLEKLRAAGFTSMEVQPTRVYHPEESREFLAAAGLDPDRVAPLIDGKFISAFIRATKPAAAACCGPTCCG
jgi:arsenite methyltransferase